MNKIRANEKVDKLRLKSTADEIREDNQTGLKTKFVILDIYYTDVVLNQELIKY